MRGLAVIKSSEARSQPNHAYENALNVIVMFFIGDRHVYYQDNHSLKRPKKVI